MSLVENRFTLTLLHLSDCTYLSLLRRTLAEVRLLLPGTAERRRLQAREPYRALDYGPDHVWAASIKFVSTFITVI